MVAHRLICCALASCLSIGTAFASNTAPFKGKWVLDKKKTQAPGGPEDLQLEVKEKGDGVLIKSKYREPKSSVYPLLWVGIMTYELDLPTDGTEKTSHIGPFTHVSKTTVEGNTMMTEFDVFTADPAPAGGQQDGEERFRSEDSAKAQPTIQGGQASTPVIQGGKWVRMVSEDGREMTLQISAKASDGRELNETLVFRKK